GLLDGERLPGVGHLQAHAGDGGELGAGGGVAGGHRGYGLSSRRGVQVSMGGSVGWSRQAGAAAWCRGRTGAACCRGRTPWRGSERPERLNVLVELLGAEAQVQSGRATDTDGGLGAELQLEPVRTGLELPGRLGTCTGSDARLAADGQAEELVAGL